MRRYVQYAKLLKTMWEHKKKLTYHNTRITVTSLKTFQEKPFEKNHK